MRWAFTVTISLIIQYNSFPIIFLISAIYPVFNSKMSSIILYSIYLALVMAQYGVGAQDSTSTSASSR